MCTLTFAWQVFADADLVVAANRDELLDRPSRPPERIDDEYAVVAPRDKQAGGTWIGYNGRGLFAGITNRWTDQDREGERSRGLLVREVLRQPTAHRAVRLIEREVAERTYEGFNMVVADGISGEDGPPIELDREPSDPVSAILVEYDGQIRTRVFEPGVHVVVNVGADSEYAIPADPEYGEAAREQAGNADRLRVELIPEPGETATEWRERARAAIGDHEYGVCVHRDGFGTRSSSLLTFGEGGVGYQYADGPPCETDYERVDASAIE